MDPARSNVDPDMAPSSRTRLIRGKRHGEVYKRLDGLYDWRLVSTSNGEIVGTSGGQGFTTRNEARARFKIEFPKYPVRDVQE